MLISAIPLWADKATVKVTDKHAYNAFFRLSFFQLITSVMSGPHFLKKQFWQLCNLRTLFPRIDMEISWHRREKILCPLIEVEILLYISPLYVDIEISPPSVISSLPCLCQWKSSHRLCGAVCKYCESMSTINE